MKTAISAFIIFIILTISTAIAITVEHFAEGGNTTLNYVLSTGYDEPLPPGYHIETNGVRYVIVRDLSPEYEGRFAWDCMKTLSWGHFPHEEFMDSLSAKRWFNNIYKEQTHEYRKP